MMGFYTEKDIEIERLHEENARLTALNDVAERKLGEIRDTLAKLIRERDEARAELHKWRTGHQLQGVHEDLMAERGSRLDAEAEAARLKKTLADQDAMVEEAAYELTAAVRAALMDEMHDHALTLSGIARLEGLILAADAEDWDGPQPHTLALEAEARRIRAQREEGR